MDLLNVYLKDIQKFPLLSAEEEKELARNIKKGCELSLKKLINSNLRLVVSVAGKYSSFGIPMMDLIQEGNMGLMAAAKKFEATFKTRFSTYAYPWIMQYMIRYAKKHSSMIALPARKAEMIAAIEKTKCNFMEEYGREASIDEISKCLGISKKKIRLIEKYAYTISSLEQEINDSETSTLCDFIADRTYCPEDILLQEERAQAVRSLVESLSEREKEVIFYRYNFEASKGQKTLREIAGLLGLSPEAVRQTEIRALFHMKKTVEEDKEVSYAIS